VSSIRTAEGDRLLRTSDWASDHLPQKSPALAKASEGAVTTINKSSSWIIGIAALICLSSAAPAQDQGSWIGTWGTSPVGLPTVPKIEGYTIPPPTKIKGTIRYRLRISLGGSPIRLRFSNEYSDSRLSVAAATVGLAGDGLDALPGSLKRVTFSGKESVTIPARAPALSDPVELVVKPLSDLVVSIYVPDGVSLSVWTRPFDPIVVEGSDATLVEHLSASNNLSIRPIISEVDVRTDRARKVVVTLGDSITDGDVDVTTGERGWPGALARRLQTQGIAVVNAGIGGNRLLQSLPMFGAAALYRLDRDVLSVPGLSYIIVLEGINDIGMSGPGGMFGDAPLVDPQALIAAYSQIITRAHERGVKVFGATIMPFEGAGYYSAEKEKVRETVNEWIRTSKAFDAVIDFDKTVRDTGAPHKLSSEYDSGDHLHPSSDGYRKIGESIDLSLFN
jgi:lysophospholipase L1-like esterase